LLKVQERPECKNMTRRGIDELIRSSELAILGAILLITLGSLGIFLSIAGIDRSVLSGSIFIACGIAYFVYAFATRDDGEALWRTLTGLLYLFGGLYLFLYSVPALESQNVLFMVGTIVLLEGVIECFIFSRLRRREGSGWIAAGAIATILLAVIICCLWRFSSMRLIGGVIGTKFVISGVSRLMYSLSTHKKLEAIARNGYSHDSRTSCKAPVV
jgi:uncharacterized membrane protein HdeD (DUF308 family)